MFQIKYEWNLDAEGALIWEHFHLCHMFWSLNHSQTSICFILQFSSLFFLTCGKLCPASGWFSVIALKESDWACSERHVKGVQVCGVTCLSGCPWGAGNTAVQYGNWVHSLLIRIFIQETDVQFEGDTLGSLSPAVLAHTPASVGSEGLEPSAAALISLNGAPSAEEKTLRWWSHTRHYWDKTPDQIQPWWAAFHQR